MASDASAPKRSTARRAADVDLVRRALAREHAAVDRLVERLRCVPRMLTAKNAQLGGPLRDHELQDLVQDAIYAVWRKLPEFEGRSALETWLYRFCFLELMRRLREERRLPSPLTDVFGDAELQVAAPSAVTTAADTELVYHAIAQLPDGEAAVVRLKHFDELTFAEIGDQLELSPNTAKTRYYRAILKLRTLVGAPMIRELGEGAR